MTYTDHSGTIAAANTSQLLCAANDNRQFLLVQGDVWINFGSAATEGEPSIAVDATNPPLVLGPGEVSGEAVYIIANDTRPFTCKEA